MAKVLSHEDLLKRDQRRTAASDAFKYLLTGVAVFVILLAASIIFGIIWKGAPAVNWEFLTQSPRDGMTAGGIFPQIQGTVLLMLGTLVIVLPLGVLGGVFLSEYAHGAKWLGFARSVVTSMAGCPSIVFGLFGFAVFVTTFGLKTSLLAGWLTLAMMTLPVIVLNTEQAVSQVPQHLIDSAVALGLTRWQVVLRVIIPSALPGIATGLVLATGRAAGEAPPILLTAGIYFQTGGFNWSPTFYKQPVENLSYHLVSSFEQAGVIPDRIAWGTGFVLMCIILTINLGAIIVRSRARKRTEA